LPSRSIRVSLPSRSSDFTALVVSPMTSAISASFPAEPQEWQAFWQEVEGLLHGPIPAR
jgi:hypothetical protein